MSSSTFGLIIWSTVSCVGVSASLTLGHPDIIGFGTLNTTVFAPSLYSTVSTLFLGTDKLNDYFFLLNNDSFVQHSSPNSLYSVLATSAIAWTCRYPHISVLVIFIFATSKKYKILIVTKNIYIYIYNEAIY